MFKKYILIACTFFLSIFLFSTESYAAGHTGSRKIVDMGCHLGDDTCYVTLDSNIAQGNCAATTAASVRWSSSSVGGRNALTLLTAAYMSGKRVSFYITDACYNSQSSFATFGFYTIAD